MKTMSVWEQRANQLRRQNRASCEVLYNELESEDCLHLSSTLHFRLDMRTHLDRPLVVEPKDRSSTASHQHHHHSSSIPEEVMSTANQPPHCRPHHGDRDEGQTREETNCSSETGNNGRHHVHHSRSKDRNGRRGRDKKSETTRCREGCRRHHHDNSVSNRGAGGVTSDREHHHHHHSHRQTQEGNGTVNSGGERRSRHKDGDVRGEGRANRERRRHWAHGSTGHTTYEGEQTHSHR